MTDFDWYSWRASHPEIFIARSGDDGSPASWQDLLRREGQVKIDSILSTIKPRDGRKVYLSQVLDELRRVSASSRQDEAKDEPKVGYWLWAAEIDRKLTELCMHGVHKMGWCYAQHAYMGGPLPGLETVQGSDGQMYQVQGRARTGTEEEIEALRVKAEVAVRELYEQTGVSHGNWVALVDRVKKTPRLIQWLITKELLPRKPHG